MKEQLTADKLILKQTLEAYLNTSEATEKKQSVIAPLEQQINLLEEKIFNLNQLTLQF